MWAPRARRFRGRPAYHYGEPFERQPVRSKTTPQGLHEDLGPRSSTVQHAPFTPPKVASTPPGAPSYATGSGAFQETATCPPHTDPLQSPFRRLSVHPFTQQVPPPIFLGLNHVAPNKRLRCTDTIARVCMATPHQPRHYWPSQVSSLPEALSSSSYSIQLRRERCLCPHGATVSLRYTLPPLSRTLIGTSLIPLFGNVVEHHLYSLENTSAQVFRSQGTRIDK